MLLQTWRAGGEGTFYPAPVPVTANLWPVLLLLPAVGVVGSLFLSKPRVTYVISGDTFGIKTLASTTLLPRTDTRVTLTPEPLGMRLFGTAVPGYYTGTYATKLGNVQAAATTTRPQQALMLEYGGKRYYLTPSDPQAVAEWLGEAKG